MCAAGGIWLGPLFIQATVRQTLFYLLLLGGLILFYCWDSKICLTVLSFILCGWYGAVILFRMASVLLTLVRRLIGRPCEHVVRREELAALDPDSLPVYTVLVPMYKEPEVAEKIIRAVTALDYPQDKLDVKLLLEEDDAVTRGKVAAVVDRLPSCVEVLACPKVAAGEPRTKPRACNWGLSRARGEYLVIYDAEDHPEGDQLKKAIVTFRKLEAAGQERVACLQAKLNYFNPRQNVLTRFFALEYTAWFDLFLPGLHALHTPIPLGGTSNHFKMEALVQLGGWDPYNVTEDCDLGLRLARQGFLTHILDSTTWEEANSRVGNWVRQRSRWVKGYFQTHLVHTRDSYWPSLILAVGFLLLARLIAQDAQRPELADVRDLARTGERLCWAGAGAGAALALWAFVERLLKRLRGRDREGRLGLYDAFTSRLCVGWMSLMLLLNVFFWVLTGAYLLREPLADALPRFTDRFLTEERTTPREFLRTWKLYHTEVQVEHYQGCTLWNTTWKWLVRREIGWGAAREMFAAIDPWSFWSQLLYPVVIGLFLANFMFVLLGVAACAWRRLWDLLPYALLVPFYWVLISVGAFKGAWQLCWNPFYWEKTKHGLTEPGMEEPTDGRPPRDLG